MQEKKYKSVQNIDNTENKVLVLIKDGYKKGDTLNLNYEGLNYSWNEEKQTLQIDAKENMNISHVVEKISLHGDGFQERLLNVKFASKNGFVVDLQNYNITPNIDIKPDETFSNSEESLMRTSNMEYAPTIEWSSGFLMHEEKEEEYSNDVLEFANEEKLPFYLNHSKEGDVYKILKDSFLESNELEIWGYNVKQDKINIEDFKKEYGETINYSISKNEDSLLLNIAVNNHDFNIVLKDTSNLGDLSLEDILQNIIVDSFSKS